MGLNSVWRGLRKPTHMALLPELMSDPEWVWGLGTFEEGPSKL
jgi:hypothetical protein